MKAILQLHKQLLKLDMDPGTVKDLSAGLDACRHQAPSPPAITLAGRAQASLTWGNFAHGFISPIWKSQQAGYCVSKSNPSSSATWAADLLCCILKFAHRQWDHWNKVLHKLQPDHVIDLTLDHGNTTIIQNKVGQPYPTHQNHCSTTLY